MFCDFDEMPEIRCPSCGNEIVAPMAEVVGALRIAERMIVAESADEQQSLSRIRRVLDKYGGPWRDP